MDHLALKTEGLTKHYRNSFWRLNKVPSLDHLTVEIERGVVFGFLGPNGAGKTTTIRCLIDLIRPTSGKAWVLGRPVGDVKIREQIGYLPDAPAFHGHLTAQQFLMLCAKLFKQDRMARQSRVEEVLEAVRMSEHANRALGGFSRGMIQRIGIAQALMNRPELLILDEPLVGLDPHGRKELLEIVLEQKKKGTTVFFCSHILSDVEKLCDSAGILYRGKLLAHGSLNDLLAPKGMNLIVPPSHDNLAKELMVESDGNQRLESGAWQLEFNIDKWKKISTRELPDEVKTEPIHEGLESFFFRTVKGASDGEEVEEEAVTQA